VQKVTRKTEGFTLIELLIVIAVIAILAALAIPNLIGSRKAANETNAISQLRTIITAQESYKSRNLGGTNKYGTLAELKTKKLVNWPTATFTKNSYTFSDVIAAPTTTEWGVAAKADDANSGDREFVATNDGFVRSKAQGTALPTTVADAQAWDALQ
jgi:prepilin-type N-terminal cleavage/methylation domain-containing protein